MECEIDLEVSWKSLEQVESVQLPQDLGPSLGSFHTFLISLPCDLGMFELQVQAVSCELEGYVFSKWSKLE